MLCKSKNIFSCTKLQLTINRPLIWLTKCLRNPNNKAKKEKRKPKPQVTTKVGVGGVFPNPDPPAKDHGGKTEISCFYGFN